MNLRDALNLHRVDRKPTTGLPDVITKHSRFHIEQFAKLLLTQEAT